MLRKLETAAANSESSQPSPSTDVSTENPYFNSSKLRVPSRVESATVQPEDNSNLSGSSLATRHGVGSCTLDALEIENSRRQYSAYSNTSTGARTSSVRSYRTHSSETGHPYYEDTATGEVTWTLPVDSIIIGLDDNSAPLTDYFEEEGGEGVHHPTSNSPVASPYVAIAAGTDRSSRQGKSRMVSHASSQAQEHGDFI